MRYQERIYIQNANEAVRNKDILNVNMSSDICVFKSPLYNLSGATKILTDICSCPSGYTDLGNGLCQQLTYTAATAPITPVTINQTTTSNAYIVEGAVIYDDITYKQWPLITTPQTFATATFNTIIPTSGTANGVSYASISPAPLGGGQHQNVNTALPPAPTGTTGWGLVSPRLYYNGAIRESIVSINTLYPGAGNVVEPQQFLWGMPWSSGGTNTNNWFDTVGLWGSGCANGQWYGFVQCIDIPVTQTYYIAFAGNNAARISLNGELMVEMNIGDGYFLTLTYANIVPVTLSAGTHVLGLEGLNYSGNGGVALDIYDCDLMTLTGITSYSALTAVTLFSTASKQGATFEIGTVTASTFSCPTGYLYSNCSGSTCVAIETIDCTASTICTTGNSYVISTATTIPVEFQFTGNVSTFTANNATFSYEIYKYNSNVNAFVAPAVYKSGPIEYSSFSATSATTQLVPVSGLSLDGEYIVKGYYNFDVCTDFLGRLGKTINTLIYRSGTSYGLYDDNLDWYFMAMKAADVPSLLQSSSNTPPPNALFQQIILPESGTTEVIITNGIGGDFILTLNGLVLANNLDYTYTGSVVTLSSATVTDDIITIIYTNTGGNNLVGDVYDISSPISSGTTGNQGSNVAYFNTSTGKYEIYTQVTPLEGNSIIVMINGATLANGIDYYQSTSNPKRIILEGNILVGDIITIVYFPKTDVVNGLITNSPTVTWQISNPPQQNNGIFTLEVSTGSTFNDFFATASTPYQVGVTLYSLGFTASGTVGTNLYYRVKNQKSYTTICGQVIDSTVYSETMPVTIQTNSINSY